MAIEVATDLAFRSGFEMCRAEVRGCLQRMKEGAFVSF